MKQKVLFPLIGIAFGLLIAVVMGEIAVRLFSPSEYVTPGMLKERSLRYEPSLFARYVFPKASTTIWVDSPSSSEKIPYHINEKGYRGRNFTVEKPAGVTRIIFFGGSSVFDLWNAEDWPHQVENILRQSGFQDVEVINAGVPGHASFDQVGRLFSEGHLFAPDYVVLYNSWNDIKYFRSDEPLLRSLKPYVESSDPRLNYRGPMDRFLSEHSHAYNSLRRGYYRWKLNAGAEGEIPPGEYSSEISQLSLKQYKLNIEMFVDLSRNIGAVPILMTEARLVTQDNPDSQRSRINYELVKLTHEGLYNAFIKTDEIIYEVAKVKNVDLIDAAQLMRGKDEFFADHVHLSGEGSRVLASITAHHMAQILVQTTLAKTNPSGSIKE